MSFLSFSDNFLQDTYFQKSVENFEMKHAQFWFEVPPYIKGTISDSLRLRKIFETLQK